MTILRMLIGRPGLPILHSRGKTQIEARVVRPKSQWTPGNIVLWLIAAIAATLIVCSQVPSASGPPAEVNGTSLDVEIVD